MLVTLGCKTLSLKLFACQPNWVTNISLSKGYVKVHFFFNLHEFAWIFLFSQEIGFLETLRFFTTVAVTYILKLIEPIIILLHVAA